MGYMKQLDMILKSLSSSWREYKRLQEEADAFLHGEKSLIHCDMKVQIAIEQLEREGEEARRRAIMQLAQEGIEERIPKEVEDELEENRK